MKNLKRKLKRFGKEIKEVLWYLWIPGILSGITLVLILAHSWASTLSLIYENDAYGFGVLLIYMISIVATTISILIGAGFFFVQGSQGDKVLLTQFQNF